MLALEDLARPVSFSPNCWGGHMTPASLLLRLPSSATMLWAFSVASSQPRSPSLPEISISEDVLDVLPAEAKPVGTLGVP